MISVFSITYTKKMDSTHEISVIKSHIFEIHLEGVIAHSKRYMQIHLLVSIVAKSRFIMVSSAASGSSTGRSSSSAA
jgi:hypothetical protein